LGGGRLASAVLNEGRPCAMEQPEVDVRLISPATSRHACPHPERPRLFRRRCAGRLARAHSRTRSLGVSGPMKPHRKNLTMTFFPAFRECRIVGDVKLDSLDETGRRDHLSPTGAGHRSRISRHARSFGMSLTVRATSDPRNAISRGTAAVHQVTRPRDRRDEYARLDFGVRIAPALHHMLRRSFAALRWSRYRRHL